MRGRTARYRRETTAPATSGRVAFDSPRLEEDYLPRGPVVHTARDPYDAGLCFALSVK